jgi:hypothetical protein
MVSWSAPDAARLAACRRHNSRQLSPEPLPTSSAFGWRRCSTSPAATQRAGCKPRSRIEQLYFPYCHRKHFQLPGQGRKRSNPASGCARRFRHRIHRKVGFVDSLIDTPSQNQRIQTNLNESTKSRKPRAYPRRAASIIKAIAISTSLIAPLPALHGTPGCLFFAALPPTHYPLQRISKTQGQMA